MADPFPSNLRGDVQAELLHILPMLKEAGWAVEPITWEVSHDRVSERRICFTAKSSAGKQIHSTCAVSRLPSRLIVLLTNA